MANAARMNFEMPVLLINLKRQPDRRKQSLKLLRELGFSNIQVVDAFDGASLLHECSGRARKKTKTQWRLTYNVDGTRKTFPLKTSGLGNAGGCNLWGQHACVLCPAKIWIVGTLSDCKLGQALMKSLTISDHEAGKLILILCSFFAIMGAGMTLQDLTAHRASDAYNHLKRGEKPPKYFPPIAALASAYGRASSRDGLCVAKGVGRTIGNHRDAMRDYAE